MHQTFLQPWRMHGQPLSNQDGLSMRNWKGNHERELEEETGIKADDKNWLDWNFSRKYKIYSHWKHRYDENTKFSTEHVFSVCVDSNNKVILSPREHVNFMWMFWREAADKCFSWTNVLAVKELPVRFQSKSIE